MARVHVDSKRKNSFHLNLYSHSVLRSSFTMAEAERAAKAARAKALVSLSSFILKIDNLNVLPH